MACPERACRQKSWPCFEITSKKHTMKSLICKDFLISRDDSSSEEKGRSGDEGIRCNCAPSQSDSCTGCNNAPSQSTPCTGCNDSFLMLKAIWENLYRCRELELKSLWTRSTFLWTLIALALSGYFLLLKGGECCCIRLDSPNGRLLDSPNGQLLGAFFGIVIYILGILDFFMAKGSKFWYEVYENKINFIEKNCLGKSFPFVLRNDVDSSKISLIPQKSSWWRLRCYRYSPSRINIFIGLLVALIGLSIALFHVIYLSRGYTPVDIFHKLFTKCVWCNPVMITLILLILVPVILHFFFRNNSHRKET